MYFSPRFRFPLCFRQIFRLRGKFSKFYLFPETFFDFHPPKISDDLFLVINHKFPPIFAISIHFPLFRQNYSFPLFKISSPAFGKFTCLYIGLLYFSFPPTFTMMHLCITQCTYWTPLPVVNPSFCCSYRR